MAPDGTTYSTRSAGRLVAVKIAFVGPVPPIRGGIAQHSARLVTALREAGHSVDVWSWRQQYPAFLYRGEQVDTGVALFPDTRFVLRWWSPLSWVRVGRQARGCDIVVVPWVHPVQVLPLRAVLAASGSRAARVAVVHNVLPHERIAFDARLTRVFTRALTGAVVQTTAQAAALTQIAPALPTALVPHPPNLELLPGPLPPRPPIRLLCLGFVRRYKGIDLALDAVRVLAKDRDVHLTVAGEFWEPSAAEFQADIARLGLTAHVTMVPGYVGDETLERLLRDHHIVLAPYRTATQSGVVPLAQAAGRPVVATPVAGLEEQLTHGIDAVVADAVTGAALARAVEIAADRLESLSAGARDLAPRWSAFAQAIIVLGDRTSGSMEN